MDDLRNQTHTDTLNLQKTVLELTASVRERVAVVENKVDTALTRIAR